MSLIQDHPVIGYFSFYGRLCTAPFKAGFIVGKHISEGKRAGIRVMTLDGNATSTGTNSGSITDATWKWVSWEINVDTYFDIIMGRRETTDTAETADVIRQYGPRQWAYQRAGWTSYKTNYRLIPGNHRWVNTRHPFSLIDYNSGGKGAVNFSATFSSRPTYTSASWAP